MTEEPIVDASPSRPPYVDRSGALTAFGVVQLLIALVCLGFAALVLVTAGVMARQAATLPSGARPLSFQQASASAIVYLGAAVIFAWLGAGSLLARRWARTLTLILSWVWLLTGILGLLFSLLLGPTMLAQTPGGAAFGAGGGMVFLGCVGLFLGAFFILLPGAFLLFYRSPNVQATFEAKDPVVRWTDRCPAPVLAVSLSFALNVVYLPLSFLSTPAFPVFGFFVSGLAGVALRLALAVICGMLAVGLYKLQPAAWWATLGLWIVGTVSAFGSFRHPESWRELYSRMGMAPEQVEMSVRIYSSILASRSFLVLCGCMFLAALSYLLWIRRYFVPGSTSDPQPNFR